MSNPAYRTETDEEPVREVQTAALHPATRLRLIEACEHGEALASRRPRWTGRPARWLLAAGAGAVAMLAPLVGSIGRIDQHPFANSTPDLLLLAGAILWGLALGALALRSFALRRGRLPAGVYLFAPAVVAIGGGRLRAWPTSRVRAITQLGPVVTLDLGPEGRLRLATDEEDLALALARIRERLAEARTRHQMGTIGQLDPLHHERDQATLAPLAGPVRPPTGRDPRGRSLASLGLAAATVAASVVLAGWVSLGSDALGIARARNAGDIKALQSYVRQHGPLVEQADLAWLAIVLALPGDEPLVAYLQAPYARHRPLADDGLARRVLQRAWPGRSVQTMTRADLLAHDRFPEPERLAAVRSHLQRYLTLASSDQPLRPAVEQRLFDLSIQQAERFSCDALSWQLEEAVPPANDLPLAEPLALYLDQTDERGDQARETRLTRSLSRAARCHTLEDLHAARPLARTPAQQASFVSAWRAFFEARQAEVRRGPRTEHAHGGETYESPPLPREVATRLDQLWGYLAAHPETPLQFPRPSPQLLRLHGHDDTPPDAAGADASRAWRPLVELVTNQQNSKLWMSMEHTIEREFQVNLLRWRLPADGPHLTIQPVASPPGVDMPLAEAALALPGSSIDIARFSLEPHCQEDPPALGAPWRCDREAPGAARR